MVKAYSWENVQLGKCRRGEMSIQGSLRREIICQRNFRRGSVRQGSVHGEVSVEELCGYQFISETFSEELF